jgi:hypothetical protein
MDIPPEDTQLPVITNAANNESGETAIVAI